MPGPDLVSADTKMNKPCFFLGKLNFRKRKTKEPGQSETDVNDKCNHYTDISQLSITLCPMSQLHLSHVTKHGTLYFYSVKVYSVLLFDKDNSITNTYTPESCRNSTYLIVKAVLYAYFLKTIFF